MQNQYEAEPHVPHSSKSAVILAQSIGYCNDLHDSNLTSAFVRHNCMTQVDCHKLYYSNLQSNAQRSSTQGQGDRYRRPSMIVNIPDIYRMFPHHNM
jgi:hypothetical protein